MTLAYFAFDSGCHVENRRQAAVASVRHLHALASCHSTTSYGQPPRDRVTADSTFLSTGLDYAGPISIRTSKDADTAHRRDIAVFICFWSKAIHLEVVSDYNSEAFIAALRRFVSRRSLCTDIYSDCGTTFIGADRTLRELFKASTSEGHHIARAASTQGIRWHFNPPAASHFGGLWEAALYRRSRRHFGAHTRPTLSSEHRYSRYLSLADGSINLHAVTLASPAVDARPFLAAVVG
ncbi:uncharacterized protein LOC114941936 [Nylanderia fulva]|uniref:uncharacterized protein LOC114941936 n=1 Tax=Nylanderia fulva TaxID=613905 RepID=UPI0010FB425E|nr:uncharacterized protein LOC114941936 [Nylanderia fulva]